MCLWWRADSANVGTCAARDRGDQDARRLLLRAMRPRAQAEQAARHPFLGLSAPREFLGLPATCTLSFERRVESNPLDVALCFWVSSLYSYVVWAHWSDRCWCCSCLCSAFTTRSCTRCSTPTSLSSRWRRAVSRAMSSASCTLRSCLSTATTDPTPFSPNHRLWYATPSKLEPVLKSSSHICSNL